MLVKHETFEIPGVNDSIIRGDVRAPLEPEGKLPAVFVCHGFKGFKNWGFHPYIGEQIALAGYVVVHLNFSHNGVGEDLLNFTELERFKENRFSYEIDDLKRVALAAEKGELPLVEYMDLTNKILLGHSRGAIAIFNGAAEIESVTGVVGLATVCDVTAPREDTARKWREDGVSHVKNMRTGEELPLGLGLLEEMESGKGNLEEVTKSLKQKVLIVHGDEDPAVPLEHGQNISAWAKNSKLYVVKGGDHVFGARHPFQGTTPELEEALGVVKEFLSTL